MITNYGIEWAPLLPWSVVYLVIGLSLATLLGLLVLKSKGSLFRSSFIALITLFIANPTLHEKISEPLPELIIAVVDNSPSMTYDQRRRQASDALSDLHAQVNKRSDLVLKTISVSGTEEQGTNIFANINLTQEEKSRLSGVVFITDGLVHDIPASLAETDIPDEVPLHLLLAGDPQRQDRRLIIEQAPAFSIIGQTAKLTYRIVDDNADNLSLPAWVTLRQNGEKVSETQVPVGVPFTQELLLENRGLTTFDLSVEPLPDEITEINNRAIFETNGVRDRLKVLLISGEPHPGERAWRNILKADPSVDLIHFTILRHPQKQDGTPIRELSLIAFPIHELFEVKLADFDLIIFDQYQRQGFLPSHYLTNIVRYVEQGGALLEVGGPGYASPASLYNTSLGTMLPAEPLGTISETAFHPLVTELGLRHPVTASLPDANTDNIQPPTWGRWFRQVDTDTLSGWTVMTGAKAQPLLVLDHFGKGRVAQITSDHIWLWGRNVEGGGPQTELIRRLAHWLMKEPELDEEQLKASLSNNRLTVHRQSLSDTPVELTVESPSGEIFSLPLEPGSNGLAIKTIEATEPGV
ncbi:hypothetical protein O4H49_13700 [Kiloniella laminariae]|uniref:Glutamine amidotransferase domain-containing protein n=1 Tax=Kiloniella laminariae TaxID=454162 RepID=A0ABT4LL60_9PROT|nr:hypothetical protein [Kiloniella laminariae]MCZ4281840.1 hypothetical protein [Kiloniella laminariae]